LIGIKNNDSLSQQFHVGQTVCFTFIRVLHNLQNSIARFWHLFAVVSVKAEEDMYNATTRAETPNNCLHLPCGESSSNGTLRRGTIPTSSCKDVFSGERVIILAFQTGF
jgi:hypothetical protein